MLALFIVLPCLVVGAGAVIALDRMGVLGSPDSGPGRTGSLADAVPRAALVAALAVMALWVAAWVVALVIGLSVLSS